jgi:hypothetical protein
MVVKKIAVTFCTQCNSMLEPGSAQCGQTYSPGEPMGLRSWDTQDDENEWLVVRTEIPLKCFEAARNERGNVRWPKDPDAVSVVVDLGAPAPVALPVVVADEPAPEPTPAPAPTPEIDTRDAEIAALRARVAELEAPPPPEPETHFADLMLADETIDDARERLSQRLRELRHYLIAPEIKVNEDGSVGLTAGEQAELQDLERRQTLGRWLEA